MSIFTGPQRKGAMREHRALRREEAEARAANRALGMSNPIVESRKREAARQIANLRAQFGGAR